MKRSIENLSIRPLFYDALSGEFNPATDPQRKHTLGRLIVATFLKGDTRLGHPYADPLEFTYRPSWASGVGSTIDCDQVDKTTFRVSDITLRSSFGELLIADDTTMESARLLISTSNNREQYSLGLGKDLALAKSAVTKAANEFFAAKINQ